MPNDAIWCHVTQVNIVSGNGSLPDGIKPFPELVVIYYNLCLQVKFYKKYSIFYWRKLIWKCGQQIV